MSEVMNDIEMGAVDNYSRAREDLLMFKSSFDKLTKAEKDRLVHEMVGMLMPNSSSFQKGMVKNFVKPYLVK
ncbi:MAG: hypothetical protein IKZ82_09390 [Clostridia bacterium]|nr:hypothetical protein [Clostridia bacterium]